MIRTILVLCAVSLVLISIVHADSDEDEEMVLSRNARGLGKLKLKTLFKQKFKHFRRPYAFNRPTFNNRNYPIPGYYGNQGGYISTGGYGYDYDNYGSRRYGNNYGGSNYKYGGGSRKKFGRYGH